MTQHFLSVKEVSERIGVKNAAQYKLPEPDATIGSTRGWLPETIDYWRAHMPGQGAGGGRPRKDTK
ncbi:hypothetical protein [Aeriscardovia aeriphila]|uniref:Uncharacterized protein n=1 Tax=Aeriscardovia aeriphila TaxID=218139 RepID=A0A261FA49_9BIFI|nr:hypothetical protein [Aeriscardovia aeriphila]NYI25824.1 hypothetical protein [Aeriscardovia aeriphila]OZG56027.1 hypothetical protein AEAE_0515 [Aeriscardovia aeriphila]